MGGNDNLGECTDETSSIGVCIKKRITVSYTAQYAASCQLGYTSSVPCRLNLMFFFYTATSEIQCGVLMESLNAIKRRLIMEMVLWELIRYSHTKYY